ncbi:MAG TPA: glycosyltransferase family 39 protein [Vicinamibacterales bacterium]|nr:glycosyltransferase family 39 protein [Vicinamibacterales bacterium]
MRGVAAAYIAWVLWAAWIVAHAFTLPADALAVFNGPFPGFTFWREAALEGGRALGGACVLLLAAWGAGTRATRPVRSVLHGTLEDFLFVLASGFAALGVLFLLLSFLQIYKPWPVGVTAGLLGAAGLVSLIAWTRPRFVGAATWLPDLWRSLTVIERVCVLIAVAAVASAFVGALAPETEYDALWYHLWLPVQWLRAGRPVDIVHEFISLYPLAWELPGGAALVLGGPVAAKLLHFACLPLVGLTTAVLTRRLFPSASAVLAGSFAIVTPLTIWEATTAYIDLALTWYLALSVYAALRYDESQDRRWLILSAAMMSAALAIKHLALVALPILAGALIIRETRRATSARATLGPVVLFLGIALILPSPWYARAYAASRNPVFPDLYAVFGARPAERWSPENERDLRQFKDRFGTPRTPGRLVALPWDVTVHAARFGGTFGPLFLILLPAALLGRRVSRRAVFVAGGCAAYAAIWASPVSSFQLRFLIPLVPFLAALSAEGAGRLARAAAMLSKPAGLVVHAIVIALLLFNLPPATEWHEPDRVGDDGWMTHIVRGIPAGVVFGSESRDAYLRRMVPSYGAWRHIDAALAADARVLTFAGGDHLYATRWRVSSEAVMARRATWHTAEGGEAAALAAMRDLRITHVLFDRRQIENGGLRGLAIASDAMWTCCLVRVYEDRRFALYRVRAGDDTGSIAPSRPSEAVSDVSATVAARQACGTCSWPSTGRPGSTCSVVLPSHQAITWRVSASRTTAVSTYAPGRKGSSGQVNSTRPPGGAGDTGVSVSVRASSVWPSAE